MLKHIESFDNCLRNVNTDSFVASSQEDPVEFVLTDIERESSMTKDTMIGPAPDIPLWSIVDVPLLVTLGVVEVW
jgi:hypothetical protein